MRRYLPFILLAVSVPRILLADSNRSVVSVPETAFDFGTVPEGHKVVHDFVIKNTGTADLHIQRIAPSCGCTAASLTTGLANAMATPGAATPTPSAPVATDMVKPNDAVNVHVEFDTSGFEGQKSKNVLVFTSDLDSPQITFTLRGIVDSAVEVKPVRLDFGEVFAGSAEADRTKEFSIRLKPGSGQSIASVKAVSKAIYVTKSETGEGTYKVSIDPKAPKGVLRDRVLVELSGKRADVVNVPVVGYVRSSVSVAPPTVSFGIIEGKTAIKRQVKVEGNPDRTFKILNASTSSNAVKAITHETKSGRSYVIDLELDPTQVDSELRETLDIETDDPDSQKLSVLLLGVLPPPKSF